METRHEDSDGSDIFWPGYVDAVTNLVLNLLFLLTIMIVAVFMFALELGRNSQVAPATAKLTSIEQDAGAVSKATTEENIALKSEVERLKKMLAQLASSKEAVEAVLKATIKENIALKSEVERLKKMLAQFTSIEQDAGAVSKATTEENIALKSEVERLKKMLAELTSIEQDAGAASKATTEENIALKSEVEHLKKMLAQLASSKEDVEAVLKTTIEENIALKSEVERLKKMLAQQGPQEVQSGDLVKSVDATSSLPEPLKGLSEILADGLEITVRFKEEAVALTPVEHDQLLEILKPVVESEKTSIYVEVPAGFSEAKRMGFYRAMAVRNLLLEMKVPKENIHVSVVEGGNDANATLVKVRAR